MLEINEAQIVVNKILAEAKKNGISMRKLVLRSGFNMETIRRWKLGKNDPSFNNVKEFEQAYKDLLQERQKAKYVS